MGVLTHLDQFRNKKKLKNTKKTLKHRFWTEVYPGAKLFYLSGYFPMTSTYPKNEVHNLARFISVMKFRSTNWKSEHAYIIADRMEDLTSVDEIRRNVKTDRKISLYGWIHGTFLKSQVSVHIPGINENHESQKINF
jgi:ribosome biogenesis protein BMS1